MAWYDEKVERQNTLAQAAQVQSLGSIPLIVLASAKPPSLEGGGQEHHDLWLELQQDLLLLSEDSEIRIYEVGHYPQFQSPDLVIEAILETCGRCSDWSGS